MSREWVAVRTEPETFQAVCDQCGWHSVPYLVRKHAERLARTHEKDCPRPIPPRSGAIAECGCWVHAMPGSRAGESHDDCPIHGRTLLVGMNVPEPEGAPTSPQWTQPIAAAVAPTPESNDGAA